MLYLLDANVLITAQNSFYPLNQIPEYWDWLAYQGSKGNIKIPIEMGDEIKKGKKKDDLDKWIRDVNISNSLVYKESVNTKLVQKIVYDGYANNLTDTEIEQIGQDPFLIAYALEDVENRTVVTLEVSAPSKKRHNRKIPDVCNQFGVKCCTPFQLNLNLKFSTAWKR